MTVVGERQPAEDAFDSYYLSTWHSAKYLGISSNALNGWVYRYRIPFCLVEGQRRFRREDLDAGRAKFNEVMERTTAHWRRGVAVINTQRSKP